jgi:hypothetical protein
MKVLILAYDFPPLISIGGQRPYSWYKYLPANGIEVTVVTRKWSEAINSPMDYVKPSGGNNTEVEKSEYGTIYRTVFNPNFRDKILLRYGLNRFGIIRKLISYLLGYLEFLFLSFDAKRNIYSEARKFLATNDVDVIVATGEPFILFKYASLLSREYNIPWIADYRDGWTNNQGGYKSSFLFRLQTSFYKILEQKYLASASLVTTPAQEYATELKKILPLKNIQVCYNGYDNDAFDGTQLPGPSLEKFTIAYAGTIYPFQKLEIFLDGVWGFLLNRDLDDFKIVFYGALYNEDLKKRILLYKPELEKYIEFTPRIPYKKVIEEMSKAQILLLLSAKNANWLTTKLFDYLALKRTILLVENDEGILESILRETSGGVALNDVKNISGFINGKYNDFKAGKSAVNNTINYQFYSRKVQAEKFAGILKGIMKHKA